MEDDPFWLVQLTDNAESRMLEGEAPPVEYEVIIQLQFVAWNLTELVLINRNLFGVLD